MTPLARRFQPRRNPSSTAPAATLLYANHSAHQSVSFRPLNRYLRINIEIGTADCNLGCLYCYSSSSRSVACDSALTAQEIGSALYQARELGAASVVFTGGGEPLLNLDRFVSAVHTAQGLGLDVAVFTNGLSVTEDVARTLAVKHVTVVTKIHSLNDPEVTDFLCDQKGAFEKMRRGLTHLLATSLARERRLGLQNIIAPANLREISGMWRWARNRHVYPYFELVHLQGRAAAHSRELALKPEQAEKVFHELLHIDKTQYGFDWEPVPPIPGSRCDRLYCQLLRPCGRECPALFRCSDRHGEYPGKSSQRYLDLRPLQTTT